MAAVNVIFKIDESLGAYYKSMGMNDYFDEKDTEKKGKFLLWCEEEGYDEETLIDDLGRDCTASDCASLEFDDNFPLDDSITDSTEQINAIFHILQKYYFEAIGIDVDIDDEKKQSNHSNGGLNAAQKIDQALASYYDDMGRTDYYYKQQNKKNKKGLFLTAFYNGDYDINDIENQLNDKANIDDCSYMDFDFLNVNEDKFPLHPAIIDKNDKRMTIFNILKYCYKHNMAPKQHKTSIIDEPSKISIDPSADLQCDFIRNDNKLDIITKEVEDLYKSECPTITNEIQMADNNLLLLLSIGYFNHIPVLQYFVDSFMRDRINKIVNTNINDIKVHEWIVENQYIQNLNKHYNDIDLCNKIEHAIKSYIKRISPKLFLKPMIKIKDDLYAISSYIMAASQFVEYIIRKGQHLNHSKPPFQFDLIILVKECTALTSQESMVMPFGDDICSKAINKNYYNEYMDCIGIVANRLKHNKLIYDHGMMDPLGTETDKARSLLRCMTQSYEKFVDKLTNKRGENNMNQFPHSERFCAVLDRRNFIMDTEFDEKDPNQDKHNIINRNANKKKKDEIIFFESPIDCRYLGKHRIAESQFDLLQKCVIPRIGYKSKQIKTKEKNVCLQNTKCRANVTSRQSCNGGYLLFSFSVQAWDEIKCYFFWMAQCIRFLPQDIVDVLPRLFDMKYSRNNNFDISDSTVKQIVSNTSFRDSYFNNWYTKTTSIHKQQDLDKYSHVYKSKQSKNL